MYDCAGGEEKVLDHSYASQRNAFIRKLTIYKDETGYTTWDYRGSSGSVQKLNYYQIKQDLDNVMLYLGFVKEKNPVVYSNVPLLDKINSGNLIEIITANDNLDSGFDTVDNSNYLYYVDSKAIDLDLDAIENDTVVGITNGITSLRTTSNGNSNILLNLETGKVRYTPFDEDAHASSIEYQYINSNSDEEFKTIEIACDDSTALEVETVENTVFVNTTEDVELKVTLNVNGEEKDSKTIMTENSGMSATNVDNTEIDITYILASGECGDELTWRVTSDGVLTISGRGNMYDYESSASPWYEYRDSIKGTVIDPKVTSIGNNAFDGCTELTDIYFNDTKDKWDQIVIGNNNTPLNDAELHCKLAARISSRSISLNGYIGVNYYLTFPDEYLRDENAYVTINDRRYTIPKPDDKGYKFSYDVAAAEMRDPVILKVFDSSGNTYCLLDKDGDDVTSTGYSFSVEEYITLANEQLDPVTYESLLYLLNRMSDYGKYAQIFFKHNENLGELSEEAEELLSYVSMGELYDYASSSSVIPDSGITYQNSSLSVDSGTRIYHYFTLDENQDISDYSFTVNGSVITPEEYKGRYRVVIDNIAAAELDRVFEVLVTNKDEEAVISIDNYSALSYAYRVLEVYDGTGIQTDLVNLVKSLYLYNQASDNYFN